MVADKVYQTTKSTRTTETKTKRNTHSAAVLFMITNTVHGEMTQVHSLYTLIYKFVCCWWRARYSLALFGVCCCTFIDVIVTNICARTEIVAHWNACDANKNLKNPFHSNPKHQYRLGFVHRWYAIYSCCIAVFTIIIEIYSYLCLFHLFFCLSFCVCFALEFFFLSFYIDYIYIDYEVRFLLLLKCGCSFFLGKFVGPIESCGNVVFFRRFVMLTKTHFYLFNDWYTFLFDFIYLFIW